MVWVFVVMVVTIIVAALATMAYQDLKGSRRYGRGTGTEHLVFPPPPVPPPKPRPKKTEIENVLPIPRPKPTPRPLHPKLCPHCDLYGKDSDVCDTCKLPDMAEEFFKKLKFKTDKTQPTEKQPWRPKPMAEILETQDDGLDLCDRCKQPLGVEAHHRDPVTRSSHS